MSGLIFATNVWIEIANRLAHRWARRGARFYLFKQVAFVGTYHSQSCHIKIPKFSILWTKTRNAELRKWKSSCIYTGVCTAWSPVQEPVLPPWSCSWLVRCGDTRPLCLSERQLGMTLENTDSVCPTSHFWETYADILPLTKMRQYMNILWASFYNVRQSYHCLAPDNIWTHTHAEQKHLQRPNRTASWNIKFLFHFCQEWPTYKTTST